MTFGMTNTVKPTAEFKRNLKPLLKKYHTLKNTVLNLEESLVENPWLGESYGHGIYKVRIADQSKGKGKSGGFRVLYYHLSATAEGVEMLLISIFDKSDIGTIKKADAVKQLRNILKEHFDS